MATNAYMQGRKKYSRPQAIIFANNPGTTAVLDAGTELERVVHYPDGYEIGQAMDPANPEDSLNQFIILSDHNRGPIDVSINRIEQRQRMINGRMRSYHIADKLEISLSWDMLPSRSFPGQTDFSPTGATQYSKTEEYTVDGGAGGVELLDWYNSHTGSFWVFLSYDNYKNFAASDRQFEQLGEYSEVVEMFFSDFGYSVEKRGNGTYDFWNISLRLEEV